MKVQHLSPSRLKAARLCAARLMARVEGDLDEEQGGSALVGTLAHEACKFWYRPSKFVQDPIIQGKFRGVNDVKTPDDAFKLAIASLGEKKKPKGDVVCELPQTPEGVQEARSMFEQIIAYYSRDVCRILFAERQYEGTLAGGVPVNLILDLGIDRDNGILEIVDFKTGYLTMTTEEMYDEDQCLMNLLAVRRDPEMAHFPMIQFTYFWARRGSETGPITLTPERLTDYEQSLGYTFRWLNEVQNPQETLNRFCGTCGRRFECKRFRQWITEATGSLSNVVSEEQYAALANSGILKQEQLALLRDREILTPDQVRGITDDTLMAVADKLKGQADITKKIREQLTSYLMEKMKAHQQTKLESDKYTARRQVNKSEEYNTETVIMLANEKGIPAKEVLSPRDKQVDNLLGNDPNAMSALQKTMKRSHNAEFIVISAKDKKRAKSSDTQLPAAPVPAPPPMPTGPMGQNQAPPV